MADFLEDVRSIVPTLIDGQQIDVVSDLRGLESSTLLQHARWWGSREERRLLRSIRDKDVTEAWVEYLESKLDVDHKEDLLGVGNLFTSFQRMLWLMFEAGGDDEGHVRHLIYHGFLDPLLNAPHLTPAGLSLRSVLLKTHPDLVDALSEIQEPLTMGKP